SHIVEDGCAFRKSTEPPEQLAPLVRNTQILDRSYFAYYLGSELAKHEIYRGSKEGTVTNLHLEEIRKFHVPIPPLVEQRKIAAILGTWDAAIATVERLIAALRERKKGLMQRLLTGRVRFPEFEKSEWQHEILGNLAELTAGGTPDTRVDNYWGGSIP